MKNLRLNYYIHAHKIFLFSFLLLFLCQIFFWLQTNNIKTKIEIIPSPPNINTLKILSFGDKEFLFRILALRLQNSGDVFAGFLSLKNYDYSRLNAWFKVIDSLNDRSNLIPSLAAYYFSQTQNKNDINYIIDYLDWRASKDINANWWWLFQASNLAQNELKDDKKALDLALKLAQNTNPQAPLWTKQMPAIIYAKQGNDCMSFKIIENLITQNQKGIRKISVEEMNFMRHFIDDKFKKLRAKNFDPRKC